MLYQNQGQIEIKNYSCFVIRAKGRPNEHNQNQMLKIPVENDELEVVNSFCYPGRAKSESGGCKNVMKSRN